MFTVDKYHTGKILKPQRTSIAAFSEAKASSPGTTKQSPLPVLLIQNTTVINAPHSPKLGASNFKVTKGMYR